MARKITMNGQSRKSVAEVFEDFIISQTAQGLSDITINTYRHHIHSISNHLDIQKPLEALTRKDLEAMVVSMRASGLAHNSISSYCRVFRTFSNWCNPSCFFWYCIIPKAKRKGTGFQIPLNFLARYDTIIMRRNSIRKTAGNVFLLW